MSAPALNDEVAFISGVAADGTLPLYAYAAWNSDTPATYTGGYTESAKWGAVTAATPGGTVAYYFDPASAWSAIEQQAFAAGLALWSAVANISFVQTTSSAQAQIVFQRNSNGEAVTSSSDRDISPNRTGGTTGGIYLLQMTKATVSIDTSTAGFGPIDGTFSTAGGYPWMTLLHEEGHALGLGHAGPYNNTVNAATQQFSAYDTRLWSIMSYIEPSTSSAAYYAQYPVTGTRWGSSGGYHRDPTTWMPLDVLAIQSLYGVATSTPLSGGQIFGFNTNITGAIAPFFDFTQNTTPVITIWDKGSDNTLDLSGFTSSDVVNLNPGTFSSVDGLSNNIAIAYNTAIDTLVCGSGNNSIVCNNNGDTVFGGAGNDTITGGTGNDVLDGGSGTNTIDGAGGTNAAVFSGPRSAYTVVQNGNSITVSGNGIYDTLSNIQLLRFASATTDFNGDGYGDVLWQNDNGQAGIWLLSGTTILTAPIVGSNPGPSWHVKGSGDFDGDGKADILWQNDNGQAGIWLMNGTMVLAAPIVGPNPGTSWKVICSGDFNADGKADILWQSTSGQAGIWFMNGTTPVSLTTVGNNPGTSWHVIGAGDFNGDGKADILWQNDSGQAGIWLMNGTNVISSPIVGPNPGPTWHIKGAGDFDGDGKSDILWQNDNGQAGIWFMDGTNVLSTLTTGSNPGSSWKVMGAADVNGDGKADILWQNTSGQAGVWLMNGNSPLSQPVLGNNPGSAWHMIAATGV